MAAFGHRGFCCGVQVAALLRGVDWRGKRHRGVRGQLWPAPLYRLASGIRAPATLVWIWQGVQRRPSGRVFPLVPLSPTPSRKPSAQCPPRSLQQVDSFTSALGATPRTARQYSSCIAREASDQGWSLCQWCFACGRGRAGRGSAAWFSAPTRRGEVEIPLTALQPRVRRPPPARVPRKSSHQS